MTYTEARKHCESNGAKIAVIETKEQNADALAACGKSTCWIGLSELGGSAETESYDQVWMWVCADVGLDGAGLDVAASLRGWSVHTRTGRVRPLAHDSP